MPDQPLVHAPGGRAPERAGRVLWTSALVAVGLAVAVSVGVVVGGYRTVRDGATAPSARVADRAETGPAVADLTLDDIAAMTSIAPAAGDTGRQQWAMAVTPGDSVARASRLIRALGDDAIAMLSNTALTGNQRAQEFRRLLLGSFDVDTISRLALGRHGRRATPAQFAEYQRLFRDFVVATYSRRFRNYSGETLVIKTARPAKRGVVVVTTEIARTDGPPVRVDWLVRERDGAPKVIDVVVEGVSMALTHRSEFAAVISRAGGIDGLIAELRAKTSS